MKPSRIQTSTWLLLAALLAAHTPARAQNAGLAGVVRDAAGNPLPNSQITITCESATAKTAEATTDHEGAYRFTGLGPGRCELIAILAGYVQSAPVTVTITGAIVKADLTLRQMPQAVASSGTQAKPKFESSGIRGLIDPGGYSASANAAAAAGLISDIADIRRTDNVVGTPTGEEMPCSLGPKLLRLASANPQSAEANRKLAEFDLAHGAAREAIPYLEKARQLDPGNVTTIDDLARALLMIEKFDTARQLLIALPSTLQSASYNRLLARADEGLGQFTEASEQYRLASAKEHTSDNVFGTGYELILAGRPGDAANVFQEGLTQYPLSTALLLGRGTAEFLEGHSSDALALFLRAIDLQPSDPRPYPFLVEAFAISGEQAERVRAGLKRYLNLSSTNADAFYQYARTLSHQDSSNEPVDQTLIEGLLEKAIELKSDLVPAHLQLGTLFAHRNDFADAAREFETTLRLAPEMKEVHYRLASAYRNSGRLDAANREMQLFRESKVSTPAEGADTGVDIRQFLSVVSRASQTPAHRSDPCPAGSSTP